MLRTFASYLTASYLSDESVDQFPKAERVICGQSFSELRKKDTEELHKCFFDIDISYGWESV